MYYRYGKREHAGGLQESLSTAIYISEKEFKSLIGKYKFYGIDNRCNQILFLAKGLRKKYIQYVWLFIEINEK